MTEFDSSIDRFVYTHKDTRGVSRKFKYPRSSYLLIVITE